MKEQKAETTREASNSYCLDLEDLNSKNRERLLQTFLPDIDRAHARLGYVHKVKPFNYNQEHFRTVEMRRKAVVHALPLHDAKVVLKGGQKAANETEPRPMWTIKPMQLGKTVVNPNEEYTVLTRFYPWRNRARERESIRRTYSRNTTSMSDVSFHGRRSTYASDDGLTRLARSRNVQTS